MVNATKTDCLFLLDCNIQTRFTDKAEKLSRKVGNTEILSRGTRMHDTNGKVQDHDGDFTESLVGNMVSWIESLQEKKDKRKKPYALTSIPKVMAKDKTMYSNPQRTWFSRTREGSEEIVCRIMMDPNRIMANGMLEFVSVQIQGETKERGKAGEEEEEEEDEVPLPEDEGLADMSSVAGEVASTDGEGGLFC